MTAFVGMDEIENLVICLISPKLIMKKKFI